MTRRVLSRLAGAATAVLVAGVFLVALAQRLDNGRQVGPGYTRGPPSPEATPGPGAFPPEGAEMGRPSAPTPGPAPHVTINGQRVPLPEGANLGSVIAEPGPNTPPDAPLGWMYVTRGSSTVEFTRDGRLLRWQVSPEDEADFALLDAALSQP